ncbi:MAG: hypothetical protein M0P77_04965 [Firmicutes bacterium]|nr:hypothetical protein [Bacillota bacterium]
MDEEEESHKIESNVALREHKLTLNKYDGDHLLVISYDANDWTDAEVKKNKIDFGELEPIYYPEDEANAHFNYVKDTKRATVAISFTEESQYENEYTIKTPLPANLMLMRAAELPEINKASYSESDNKVTVEGKHLDELESISFFAVNSENEDNIYLLGKLKDDEIKEKTKTDKESLAYTIDKLPDTLLSGEYYIRVTGILEGYTADSVNTDETITHTNDKQPANPKIDKITGIGDGMVKVELFEPLPPDCDGYIVNVYKGNEPTDIQGLTFEDTDKIVLYGGKYDVPVFETEIGEDELERLVLDDDGNPIKIDTVEKGLSYNVDYTLGISAYKVVDEKMYISGEVNSNKFKFTKPTTTIITAKGTPNPKTIEVNYTGEEGSKYDMPYYKEKDIELTLTADTSITGTWNLDKREDEGYHGDLSYTQSAKIELKDLSEGEHILEFNGKNDTNDSVSFSYVFTIDTMAPRLLIESPDNGGFFDNDKVLEIKGITDEDATVTVIRDKDSTPLYKGKPELDSEGRFVIQLNDLPKNHGSHKLTIIAEDVIGNKTTTERTIVNRDLGKITDWRLYAGEEDITDKNIMKKGGISNIQLSLRGNAGGMFLQSADSGGYELIIDDPNIVSFSVFVNKDGASLDSENKLTVEEGSVGVVSGTLILLIRLKKNNEKNLNIFNFRCVLFGFFVPI